MRTTRVMCIHLNSLDPLPIDVAERDGTGWLDVTLAPNDTVTVFLTADQMHYLANRLTMTAQLLTVRTPDEATV